MPEYFIVEQSMIGLEPREGYDSPHKMRGELVTAEELGNRKDRLLALGAVRKATAEERRTARSESEPAETPPVDVEPKDVGPGTDTSARPLELERQEPALGLPIEEPEARRGPGRPRLER